MLHLIDLQTSPYHSEDEIRAEIAEIKRLERTKEAEAAIKTLESWLELKQEVNPHKPA